MLYAITLNMYAVDGSRLWYEIVNSSSIPLFVRVIVSHLVSSAHKDKKVHYKLHLNWLRRYSIAWLDIQTLVFIILGWISTLKFHIYKSKQVIYIQKIQQKGVQKVSEVPNLGLHSKLTSLPRLLGCVKYEINMGLRQTTKNYTGY